MYTPYMRLIDELFTHTKIIIDKFHLVQHIPRALKKTQIRLMKKFKKHNRKSKHYRQLFLKYPMLLNTTTYQSTYCFKHLIRQIDILNFLLELSLEFQIPFQTFKTYQAYIENTLITPYTDGPIEGINHKIKVIKRIPFDDRSFYHWVTCHAKHVSSTSKVIKSCIFMIQNLTKPKTKILTE